MNINKANILRVLVITSISTLLACGGSGGGDGSSSSSSGGTALSFQPLVGSGTAHPVMDIFSKDLNGDGVDEVVIAGRRTQPATDATWQNFNVQIFGWNGGSFDNETSTWLPGGINEIVGTEPSVKFGDFDGDGDIDIFMAATTDMYDPDGADNISGNADDQTLRGDSIVFVNGGADSFTKVILESSATWSHGSAVHDFTGDGIPDIMAADYSGNGRIFYFDTTWKTLTGANQGYGSSISVGDYLNDGAPFEVVMTDDPSTNGKAVYSYNIDLVGGTYTLTKVKDLPKYKTGFGHVIRSIAMDFDGVNGTDIIAFDRDPNNYATGESDVQFLKNDGVGNFSDVTGAFLSGYVKEEGGVNYQPVVMDVNGDTFNDIFLSGTDFNGTYNSTQILLNDGNNTGYASSYSSNFAANWNAKKALTTSAISAGQNQHIVLGPSNNYYIVTTVLYNASGTYRAAVHTTNLGTQISTGL